MQQALKSFKSQVKAITGREARESEVKRFVEQYETAIAHKDYLIQFGFCDFQTLSGKAEVIEINLLTINL